MCSKHCFHRFLGTQPKTFLFSVTSRLANDLHPPPPPHQQIPVASSHSSSNDKKTRMKWQEFGGLAHPAALFAGVGLLCYSIHHPAPLGGAGLLVWITWSSALFARVGGVGEGGCGLLVDGIAALKNTHKPTSYQQLSTQTVILLLN